jgi:hypothetical protein
MSIRITQNEARVALKGTDIRVTQLNADVMGQSNPRRRVSLVYGNAMIKVQADEDLRVSQMYAQVMVDFTPNFEWIEMFIPEVFPFDISLNSIGATRFQTDVVMVDSGHDQRQSRWDQPLMEYDVAYGVRTMEHLHGLIAFFRAMQGKKHAFLYRDHSDYTSTLAVDYEARRAPPARNRRREHQGLPAREALSDARRVGGEHAADLQAQGRDGHHRDRRRGGHELHARPEHGEDHLHATDHEDRADQRVDLPGDERPQSDPQPLADRRRCRAVQ